VLGFLELQWSDDSRAAVMGKEPGGTLGHTNVWLPSV
jgi:hypothetical protein